MPKLKRVGPCKQIVHRWPEVSRFQRTFAVDGGQGPGGAGAALTLTLASVTGLAVNDIVIAPDNGTDATYSYWITAINTGTPSITIYALPASATSDAYTAQSYGTVPAFANEEALYWVGVMKTESDVHSASRIIQPEYKFNAVQTVDATVIISDHRMRSQNFGTKDWIRHRRDNLYEYRKTKEYDMVFTSAPPSGVADPSTSEKAWNMAGMGYYITQTAVLATTGGVPTESNIVDFVYSCFADNGSPRKMVLGGTDLCKAFDKVNANSSLHVTRDQNVAGVEISTIRSRKGKLYIVFHPGFDELGKADEGFCLDLKHIMIREYQPVEKRKLEAKRVLNGQDAEGEYYISKETLELRNPTAHYALSMTS